MRPILFLCFYFLLLHNSSAGSPLCQDKIHSVFQLKKANNKVQFADFKDYPDPEDSRKVDLNFDGKMDMIVHLGGCGTGGCLSAVLLNCGDDKTYRFLLEPEYYGSAGSAQIEVDKTRWTKTKSGKWAHLTTAQYWQNALTPSFSAIVINISTENTCFIFLDLNIYF